MVQYKRIVQYVMLGSWVFGCEVAEVEVLKVGLVMRGLCEQPAASLLMKAVGKDAKETLQCCIVHLCHKQRKRIAKSTSVDYHNHHFPGSHCNPLYRYDREPIKKMALTVEGMPSLDYRHGLRLRKDFDCKTRLALKRILRLKAGPWGEAASLLGGLVA